MTIDRSVVVWLRGYGVTSLKEYEFSAARARAWAASSRRLAAAPSLPANRSVRAASTGTRTLEALRCFEAYLSTQLEYKRNEDARISSPVQWFEL